MSEKKHAAVTPVKLEPRALENSSVEEASVSFQPPKLVVLADLNVDPPVSDGDDTAPNTVVPDISR